MSCNGIPRIDLRRVGRPSSGKRRLGLLPESSVAALGLCEMSRLLIRTEPLEGAWFPQGRLRSSY